MGEQQVAVEQVHKIGPVRNKPAQEAGNNDRAGRGVDFERKHFRVLQRAERGLFHVAVRGQLTVLGLSQGDRCGAGRGLLWVLETELRAVHGVRR